MSNGGMKADRGCGRMFLKMRGALTFRPFYNNPPEPAVAKTKTAAGPYINIT